MKSRIDNRLVQRIAIEVEFLIATDKDILFTAIQSRRIDALEYPNDGITANSVRAVHRLPTLPMAYAHDRILRTSVVSDRRCNSQISGIRNTSVVQQLRDRRKDFT